MAKVTRRELDKELAGIGIILLLFFVALFAVSKRIDFLSDEVEIIADRTKTEGGKADES